MHLSTSVRNASQPAQDPTDWIEIRRLCCETGNAGNPIDPSRAPFFAESWVGPYEKLCPEWSYVAVAGEKVVGYLNGCAETAQFKKAASRRFKPALLAKVLGGRFAWNGDTRRFIRRAARLERGPEDCFSSEITAHLHADFPAHLHVNVEAGFRGAGVGARLIAQYAADLRASRISGVHLFCGPAPLRFYEGQGFRELSRIEFRPGVWVYCLVKSLQTGT